MAARGLVWRVVVRASGAVPSSASPAVTPLGGRFTYAPRWLGRRGHIIFIFLMVRIHAVTPFFPRRLPRSLAPALAVPYPPPFRAHLSAPPLLVPVRAKYAPMFPKLLRDQKRPVNRQ